MSRCVFFEGKATEAQNEQTLMITKKRKIEKKAET
jgi:hypothetical protein